MIQREEISILVLYTGGTIGMMQDPKTGAWAPFDFSNIYTHVPMLRDLGYKIDFYSFDPLIDSSNMDPAFWVRLVDKIEENYEMYAGFFLLPVFRLEQALVFFLCHMPTGPPLQPSLLNSKCLAIVS